MIIKIAVVSFTAAGSALCKDVIEDLQHDGVYTEGFTMRRFAEEYKLQPLEDTIKMWVKEHWDWDGILFIGSCGIAVRSIAPYVEEELKDPAVLVMDETPWHVIPLLSGRAGRANEFADMIGKWYGSTSVITTAAEEQGKFSVEIFSARNRLYITNRLLAKGIATSVLEGYNVGFSSPYKYRGKLPDKLTEDDKNTEYRILVALKTRKRADNILLLVPKIITLGLRCKPDTSKRELADFIKEVFASQQLPTQSLDQIVCLNSEKVQGVHDYCRSNNVPYVTYPPDEPAPDEAEETNRAALWGSCEGKLVQDRISKDGMTLSLAVKKWTIEFA